MFDIFRIGPKVDAILADVHEMLRGFASLSFAVRDMKAYLEKKSTTRILLMETKIETDGGKFQILSTETFRFPETEIFRSIQIPRDLIPDMKSAWAPRLTVRITTREEKD
jgi:hypothetical protein